MNKKEKLKSAIESSKKSGGRVLRLSDINYSPNFEKIHSHLPGLKRISARSCDEMEDLNWLSKFNEIEELNLPMNSSLTNINAIANHKGRLEVLNISGCNIRNFEVLKDCELFHLQIGDNPELKDIDFLSHMSNLKFLSIKNCELIGDETLEIISSFESLEYLDISNTGITNISFVNKLKNLELLICSKNKINDWNEVSFPTTLKGLNVSGCLGNIDFSSFASLINLRKLDIQNTTSLDYSPLLSIRENLCKAEASNPDTQGIHFSASTIEVSVENQWDDRSVKFYHWIEKNSLVQGEEVSKQKSEAGTQVLQPDFSTNDETTRYNKRDRRNIETAVISGLIIAFLIYILSLAFPPIWNFISCSFDYFLNLLSL